MKVYKVCMSLFSNGTETEQLMVLLAYQKLKIPIGNVGINGNEFWMMFSSLKEMNGKGEVKNGFAETLP